MLFSVWDIQCYYPKEFWIWYLKRDSNRYRFSNGQTGWQLGKLCITLHNLLQLQSGLIGRCVPLIAVSTWDCPWRVTDALQNCCLKIFFFKSLWIYSFSIACSLLNYESIFGFNMIYVINYPSYYPRRLITSMCLLLRHKGTYCVCLKPKLPMLLNNSWTALQQYTTR